MRTTLYARPLRRSGLDRPVLWRGRCSRDAPCHTGLGGEPSRPTTGLPEEARSESWRPGKRRCRQTDVLIEPSDLRAVAP